MNYPQAHFVNRSINNFITTPKYCLLITGFVIYHLNFIFVSKYEFECKL